LKELETSRLSLRQFSLADDAFILQLLNDPAWLRYIGDRGVKTLEDAQRVIRERYVASYEKFGFGLMAVDQKSNRQTIGMCGLVRREGLDDVDIGFAFLPAFRASGYAYEAAQAVLAHGREVLKLKRVVAITVPENTASIRLLEKLGLRYESPATLPGSDDALSLYAIRWNTR
jgi:[ribosomal protein S5]-alanine N-acetyltransferase